MNLNLGLLLPEWIVTGFFVLLVLVEIFQGKKENDNRGLLYAISILGAGLVYLSLFFFRDHVAAFAFNKMFIFDSFSLFFKTLFTFVFMVILSMTRIYFKDRTEDPSEFILILWSILIGLFFLSSANHFLVMFIAVEIVTMSFYVLAAYLRKDLQGIEAGIKYLIMGSVASAFMMFGIASIYVASGNLMFHEVRESFLVNQTNPFMLLGIVFIIAGLGFKIAAVPFQLWVPDVYQGSPSPVVAFLSVASKAAGFVLLIRLFATVFAPFVMSYQNLFGGLAVVTLLYGNLGAIMQKNIKRLFGYSSIGHAGYLLLGGSTGSHNGITAMLYYFIAYAVTNLAAFYIITLVGKKMKSDEITAYAGLGKRSPFLAGCLLVSLLSLAGIPPLAGFFGKFLVLLALVKSNLLLFAIIGVLGVPISLYYYLSIGRVMFIDKSAHDDEPITLDSQSKVVILALVVGIFVLGFYQAPFLKLAEQAAIALF